jgi:cytochrome c biogenesis protein CcdA/thiol-disulfide isomerase/thioredoxin
MVILLAFAVLAGAGTALSPCVLPVLPAVLSAGGAGGRRRPVGVVVGLAATFTITIVGVAEVVGGVGLGTDPLRAIAVVVLAAFGIALLFPGVAAALEAPLARLSRFGPRSRGDGFWSGVLVGAALGFVYTPCAGPILAAVITVSAATGRTVAVAIAYALGSAAVLLALTLGGRRLLDRIRAAGRGAIVQRAMGAVMLATALLIVTNVDVSFDQLVARKIPNVSLTAGLERSTAVASRLRDLRRPTTAGGFKEPVPAGVAPGPEGLPKLGRAPEFVDTQRWFNTPGGRPEPLRSLRGRVVLVDFWTYTCINCLRTLPYLEAWDRRYRNAGLTIVGVHTPEFAFEHDAGNVGRAIRRLGIRYPVVQDNDNGTWDAYANMYWPADYLVDAKGEVRYASIGEGDYDKTENAIRLLLAEAGRRRLGAQARPEDVVVPSTRTSPETYLGTARAEGWIAGEPQAGENDYPSVAGRLAVNTFAFGGRWNIGEQAATAVRDATIDATVQAKNVYLVLSPPKSGRGTVQVLVDGRPAGDGVAGADVHGGRVTVTSQRLYTLVSLPRDGRHALKLRLSPGVSGFAFTFG